MCYTKSVTFNAILCSILTLAAYYFIHLLILYVGTIIVYGNYYDMYSGCPKNMTRCDSNERLACYDERIGGCFRMNLMFAFLYCPLAYICATITISLIVGVVKCVFSVCRTIYNECHETDHDELLPLYGNQI
jgi:hypothetical protein